MATLLALAVTVVVVGFALGAFILNVEIIEDTDIDLILANAEKPFYQETT